MTPGTLALVVAPLARRRGQVGLIEQAGHVDGRGRQLITLRFEDGAGAYYLASELAAAPAGAEFTPKAEEAGTWRPTGRR